MSERESQVGGHPNRPASDYEAVAASASSEHAAEAFLGRQRSPLERIQLFLHSSQIAAPALVLVVSFIAFSVIADNFLKPFNVSLILQQVMIVGILGIAQTLVILTAGIDLSVGTMMFLSSVVMGDLAVDQGLPVWLALLAGFGVGLACGAINGALVTRFRLPPFIATLGTYLVFGALTLYVSKSETIRAQDVAEQAGPLQWLGKSFDVGGMAITWGVVLMLGLFGLIWFCLNWTAWGRHVYAVGDDPQAALLSGIRTKRVLLSVYAVAGLICAIAGWALIGRAGAVAPQGLPEVNLDSITAVVIGGTSLFGGRGSVIGTLFGAVIVGVFRNGLALAGVDVLWQNFTIGGLILVAIAADQWIRGVKA